MLRAGMLRPPAALPGQGDVDTDTLADAFDTGGLDGWSWVTAGIVLMSAIVLSRIVKMVLMRICVRRLDRGLALLISRLVGYAVVVFGLIYALESLGVRIGPLLGALGIAGIALAFALKDILENFVAGVLLQLNRPFRYGDQVAIEDTEGTVEAIDTRTVTIHTPSGEAVKIPASTVITSVIDNYTERGRRRTTLPVGVAYGSDLRTAQRVLIDAVATVEGVLEEPEPEVLLEGFGDSSIDFAVRFWHGPTIATFWQVRSDVAFAVEAALAEAKITIPFPQRTVWYAGDTDD